MQPFTSLQLPGGDIVSVGVKIAIVSGPMRRFLTGACVFCPDRVASLLTR